MKMYLSDLIISTTASYLGLAIYHDLSSWHVASFPKGHHNISTAIQSFKYLFQFFVLMTRHLTHDPLIKLDNCIPTCRVCPLSAVSLCQVAREDNYFLSHQEKFPLSNNGQGPNNLKIYSKVSLSDGRMQSVSYTSDDYGDNNDFFLLDLS